MSLTPAYIEMDEGWVWWPVTFTNIERKQARIAVPQALLDEYTEAQQRWRQVQEKLEQLYRVQEGLQPWNEPEVPTHEVLRKD